MYISSHNCLTTEYILALYDSLRLTKKPLGFLTQILFNLAILRGWRPGALANLELGQIKKVKMVSGYSQLKAVLHHQM